MPRRYSPMSGEPKRPRHSDSGQIGARPQGRFIRRRGSRITPGFFETIGVSMTEGRTINEDDNENTRHVAVINNAFASKFFGNQKSRRPALRSGAK